MILFIMCIIAIMILPLWVLIDHLKYKAEVKALEAKGYPRRYIEILRVPKSMNMPTYAAFDMAALGRPQPDKQK